MSAYQPGVTPLTVQPRAMQAVTGWQFLSRLSLALVLLMGATSLVALAPQSAFAQEEEEEAADEEKAAPAAEGEAAAGEGEGESGAGKPRMTNVEWFLKSSGAIGAFILVLSIYFVATVSRLFVEMRPVVAMPPALVEECESLLEKRDFKGIYALVKDDGSHFARLVTAGMGELQNGLDEARDAMEHVSDVINAENERKISMLAVLGTLGPMIGLLGTLKGMIASFSAIAIQGTQLKAAEVADGISEALLLTFEGVALSVPAIYFFAVFRNRLSGLSASTALAADEFIRRLIAAAKNKTPAAPKV